MRAGVGGRPSGKSMGPEQGWGRDRSVPRQGGRTCLRPKRGACATFSFSGLGMSSRNWTEA